MFCTLFSLLVVLLPAAATAWFIQADAPDRPTVVSTVRSCDTPYRLSVYDDISSKKDNRYDTAFLHPYNPFFVPADMIELDMTKGIVRIITTKREMKIKALSPLMKQLLKDGGVIAHFNKYGGFHIET